MLTSLVGTSADAMRAIVDLYVEDAWTVADVTYGQGVFWRDVDTARFDFRPSDLADGVDFRTLPYAAESVDALVLDPPYMPSHDGDVKESLSTPYRLNETAPRSVPAITGLYAQGLVEAARVLKPKGVLVVKCQDTIENHRRHWTHVDIYMTAQGLGFVAEDLFVLTQRGRPTMRQTAQDHARSNHSFFWVLRKARGRW